MKKNQCKESLDTKRQLETWEIVLLAVGSPVWIPVLVSAVAVVFSICISLWAVIISLWAVLASVVACAPSGILAGVLLIVDGNAFAGVAMIASGIICAGLSIFIFLGSRLAMKGALRLTKSIALCIKKSFIKKEKAL